MKIRTPQEAVIILNRALKADSEAITALTNIRVTCNKALADDPDIAVSEYDLDTGELTPGQYKVGLLGILYGLLGIAANYDLICDKCQLPAPEDATFGNPCTALCGGHYKTGKLIEFIQITPNQEPLK